MLSRFCHKVWVLSVNDCACAPRLEFRNMNQPQGNNKQAYKVPGSIIVWLALESEFAALSLPPPCTANPDWTESHCQNLANDNVYISHIHRWLSQQMPATDRWRKSGILSSYTFLSLKEFHRIIGHPWQSLISLPSSHWLLCIHVSRWAAVSNIMRAWLEYRRVILWQICKNLL